MIAPRRRAADWIFGKVCLVCALVGFGALALLLFDIVRDGLPHLSVQFLTSPASRHADQAGVKVALVGTLWIMGMTVAMALPVGAAAAVYLEEYAKKSRLNTLIEINIANLAGVPSIIYGILGLAIFVRMFHLGPSVLAGSLTMALLILPVIIIASREALRAVPPSYRHASLALGATRWQTTWRVVLPAALPGMVTGFILATSRAIGETAPLLLAGAVGLIFRVPQDPMDRYTALPIQIYNWAARPQEEFHSVAAAGILVLLTALFLMNGVAALIRHRASRMHVS